MLEYINNTDLFSDTNLAGAVESAKERGDAWGAISTESIRENDQRLDQLLSFIGASINTRNGVRSVTSVSELRRIIESTVLNSSSASPRLALSGGYMQSGCVMNSTLPGSGMVLDTNNPQYKVIVYGDGVETAGRTVKIWLAEKVPDEN